MKVLVYLEARDGEPSASALGVITRVRELEDVSVDAIVCTPEPDRAAEAAAAHGAAAVLVARGEAVAEPLPQPHVDVLAAIVRERGYDAVLFATSILATDVAGGLAARLESGVNWDLTDVVVQHGDLVGKRLALGDAILADVGWTTPIAIATFRPGAFDAVPLPSPTAPDTIEVEAQPADWSGRVELVESVGGRAGAVSLADADIIVSGGRGLGEKENLQLVRELADALGGVPGVSMPLVGEGWAPYAMQVGQTGSVVRPRLYVACGISGQMQHKVGMERSGTIIAINTDENAPIVRFCDLAVIGDVVQVLPALTELVRARQQTGVAV
jgi:electron transfer flavoprotein alpha subunit